MTLVKSELGNCAKKKKKKEKKHETEKIQIIFTH